MFAISSIRFGVLGLMVACSATIVSAQAPTTVQLPSFSNFSYRGTVVVPDGGTAHLGSVKRSAIGTTRRGLSRGFGQEQSIDQATAKVQIIDNAEIDRQLLGGTPEEFMRRERAKAAQAGTVKRGIDPDREGKALVRHARQEYKRGKQSAAFFAYQLAIEKLASPHLQDLAKVEFQRVFGSSADQALRINTRRQY